MIKKERIVQTTIWFLEGLITGLICGLTIEKDENLLTDGEVLAVSKILLD